MSPLYCFVFPVNDNLGYSSIKRCLWRGALVPKTVGKRGFTSIKATKQRAGGQHTQGGGSDVTAPLALYVAKFVFPVV